MAAAPGAGGEYKLRCELYGHQEDVRGLDVCDLGLLTSSRDKTIKLWAEDGGGFSVLHTFEGHTGYVGPVAFIPPGARPDLPNGAVVSGSFDTTVRLWDPVSAQELAVLRGHAYQVTALGVLPGGDVVSASVDKTIRVWRGTECVATLEGHEGPVLSLAVTPEGDILSGSGDTTIRRWSGGRCVQTYKGHTDTVRALCILPGVGFVSGSHDQSVRVWALSGQVLAEAYGHTALVYSVAATPGGLIASGSEDNTVRLWRASGEALQAIEHPGCVWAAAFLANGDLATGCADAVARVFTADPARQDAEAAAGLAKRLEELKAAKAAKAAEGGGDGGGDAAAPGLPAGLKVDDALVLTSPGSKDGETRIVREADGSVWAYGWSAGRSEWEKIGEVVAAPEAGTISGVSTTHAGRSWDHVFDVEMDSGVKLKLAMDAHENPYIVADRFLAENELPAEFREQIVAFVLKATGAGPGPGPAADLSVTGGFCDPFTGGGGGGEAPRPPPPPRGAPPPPGAFSVTGGGVDPFTGGGGGGGSAPAAAGAPALAYLLFDAPPPGEALGKKLRELSAMLGGGGGGGLALSAEEAAPGGPLDALLARLPAAAAGAGGAPSAAELALLGRLLQWPAPQLFPALDAARCLVLDAAAAAALEPGLGSLSAPAPGTLAGALAAAAAGGAAPARQTALRLAANCFKRPALRAWALSQREALLDGFAGCGRPEAGGSKGVRLGYATLLQNYAAAACGGGGGGEAGMQVLSCLEDLLASIPADEPDAAARALGAAAALAAGDAGLAAAARDLGLAAAAARLGGGGGPAGAAAAALARAVGA
ncbi:MAG: WD40-repeat-containing domain protein [Monoraphidium minutum]|nr:MAG: WD40-repeat-containing domain protein [Monoraphidium minutum]